MVSEWLKSDVKRECESCKKEFLVLKRGISGKRKQRFCSNECYRIFYNTKRAMVYESVPMRPCAFCGKEFKPSESHVAGEKAQKFCSPRCSQSWQNRESMLERRIAGVEPNKELGLVRSNEIAAALDVPTAAYMAGLFDGEGCATSHVGGAETDYRIRLSIMMTHPEAILAFHRAFGGHYSVSERGQQATWKPVHRCELNGWRAYAALKAMVPYLKTKRDIALLCMEFHLSKTKVRGRRPTADETALRRSFHERIRALNYRGVKPPES